MKSFLAGLYLSVLFFTACGSPEESQSDALTSHTQPVQTAFSEAFDCSEDSQDLQRNWCPVTLIGSQDLILPQAKESYLGLSMSYADYLDPVEQAYNSTHLVVLHISEEEARLTELTPENEEEEMDIAEVVFNLSKILKDGDQTAAVARGDLLDFLKSEQENPGYALINNGSSAEFMNKSNLQGTIFYVEGSPYGSAYVVLEEDFNGNFYISVFPIVGWEAK